MTIEGRNFLLRFGDEAKRVGFFATRFVSATKPEAAIAAAIETVKSDPAIVEARVDGPAEEESVGAMKIREVEIPPRDFVNSGYTFFPERADS